MKVVTPLLISLCLTYSTIVTSNFAICYAKTAMDKTASGQELIPCDSYDSLKDTILSHINNRKSRGPLVSVTLSFDIPEDQSPESVVNKAIDDILKSDDYLFVSYIRHSYRGWERDDTFHATIELDFYTSSKEEGDISKRISEIISAIITDDMGDLEKETAIHDWVILNVTKTTSGLQQSAYDALFKQSAGYKGYALLTHKLLQTAGLESRIILGGSHAWNMVFICGSWYHVDPMWDDPDSEDAPNSISYDYFNKSDKEFSIKHIWDTDGDRYPEAPESYNETVCSEYTVPGVPPDKPVLITPASDSEMVPVTPTFTVEPFSDPDSEDTHLKTEWHISNEGDFSTKLYINTSKTDLTALELPEWAELPNDTTFYVRLRFYDNSMNASDWSDTISFKTVPAKETAGNDTPVNEKPVSEEQDGQSSMGGYESGNDSRGCFILRTIE